MRKIQDYLGAGDALRRLNGEARRLAELDRAYRPVVPGALAEASGVDHVDGATLFLWADSGAVAAKLRQLAPKVLKTLGKLVPECTAIRVTVRVAGSEAGRPPRPRPKLGEQGAEALRGLASALPPSPLGTALARLAARAAPPSEDGK
jgi:hypothetical protein